MNQFIRRTRYNHNKLRVLRAGLVFTLLIWVNGCNLPGGIGDSDKIKDTSGTNKDIKMSFGPPGKLTGEDLRVPVHWITGSDTYGSGEYARELTVDGRERYYEVHVPPSYNPKQKTPVILVLHGGGGFPGVSRFMTSMSELSDQTGEFLVVYAAGTHKRFKDRQLYWNAGFYHKDKKQYNVDDVKYFDRVLDDLSEHFSVDQKRIYATGISNGAHMTFRLASELSHRIAAVGTVGGQISPGQLTAAPPRPISIMHFHGRQDPWNPWNGGTPPKSSFTDVKLIPVPQVISDWVKHNGCPTQPAREEKTGQAVASYFEGCKGGAEIVLWDIKDGGHTWPGGRVTKVERTGKIGFLKVAESVGNVNHDISASRHMWSFFKKHPMAN